MAHRYLRVVPPMLLALVGLAAAMWIIDYLLEQAVQINPAVADSSLINLIPGRIRADVTWIIFYITPINFAVYIILGIPIACIMLLVTRIIKVTAFNIDIIRIGQNFGSVRMIKRAVVPALFSLSLSGVLSGLISNLLFTRINPQDAGPFYYPLITIATSLVVLPIVMAFFIPTWLLDDAGIVMHLKDKELADRRCPESIGVGRWWSNLQGGFTVVTIPVISFIQNFYNPIVLDNATIDAFFIFRGLLFTFTIPFLTMAFIMPVIVLNEALVWGTRRITRRFARSLGGRDMELLMRAAETTNMDRPENPTSVHRETDGL